MPKLSDYEELNPLDRGRLFKRHKEDQDLSYKQLGKKIGKSASFVANSVRLIDLPVAIKDGLLGGVISEGHARALASLDSLNECVSVYKEVLRTHATVRETEELVREKKDKQREKTQMTQDQAEEIKVCLEKILEVKVKKIETKSSSRKISLDIFLSS